MFTIADGREYLYQWDLDVKLLLDKDLGGGIDEVHFTAKYSRECLTVIVVHEDAGSYVMVPNILLQESYDLIVYAFCCTDKVTKFTQEIPVFAKPKPADYVYTETEVLHYADLDDRLRHLENASLVKAVPGLKDGQTLIVNHVGADGSVLLGGLDPTHGKTLVKGAEILPDTLFPNNVNDYWDGMECVLCFNLSTPLIAGESYLVFINGVEYRATAEAYSEDWIVSDGIALNFANRTIYYQENSIDFQSGYNAAYVPDYEEDTVDDPNADGVLLNPVTLGIYSFSEEVVKLPLEYLDLDAIRAALPIVEMSATFEDGTTAVYKLYGAIE